MIVVLHFVFGQRQKRRAPLLKDSPFRAKRELTQFLFSSVKVTFWFSVQHLEGGSSHLQSFIGFEKKRYQLFSMWNDIS